MQKASFFIGAFLAIMGGEYSFSAACGNVKQDHLTQINKSLTSHKNGELLSGAELLRKNGFFVSLEEDLQIFEPYLQTELPFFITVDSAFYTFTHLFRKCLLHLEFRNYVTLCTFIREFHETLATIKVPHKSTWNEAQSRSLAVFEVAGSLIGACLVSPPGRKKMIAREVQRIRNSDAIGKSLIKNQILNYNVFKPCGFYTRMEVLKRYYQAFKWLSDLRFRSDKEADAASALLMTEAFRRNGKLSTLWNKLNQHWEYFIGPVDDLSFTDYSAVMKRMNSEIVNLDTTLFQKQLEHERQPLIRIGYHGQGDAKQAFVILGNRYLPESELFYNTVEPMYPGRVHNTGLEFIALLGTERCLELMNASEGLRNRIKTLAAGIQEKEFGPFYREMLNGMRLMINTEANDDPLFMQSSAWKEKSINSVLAY